MKDAPKESTIKARRQPLVLDQGTALVRRGQLSASPFPVVFEACTPGADLVAWTRANRAMLDETLSIHGAILFRGFQFGGLEDFRKWFDEACGEMLEYKERSSPRSELADRIYSSTDHPMQYEIFFHNENAYQDRWPGKIAFCCLVPPASGGRTPIADTREVIRQLRPSTVQKFEQLGVMYRRNLTDGLGLSWQTVFQTKDRMAVEDYCRDRKIHLSWRPDGGMTISQVRPAVVRHPRTGEALWFNHAAFFHVTTLPEEIRGGLIAAYEEEDLPSNTYYGDGSQIRPAVLDELRAAYRDRSTAFTWSRGDILLLDNMLIAHSRESFLGDRRIAVAMAETISAL
jgi:alpha-ketoglutarate-dependent taurine dioxygenase